MWILILNLSWQVISSPLLEADSHPVYLRTHSASVRVEGFATRADCHAYQLNVPIQVNGVDTPYTITGRSCIYVG